MEMEKTFFYLICVWVERKYEREGKLFGLESTQFSYLNTQTHYPILITKPNINLAFLYLSVFSKLLYGYIDEVSLYDNGFYEKQI